MEKVRGLGVRCKRAVSPVAMYKACVSPTFILESNHQTWSPSSLYQSTISSLHKQVPLWMNRFPQNRKLVCLHLHHPSGWAAFGKPAPLAQKVCSPLWQFESFQTATCRWPWTRKTNSTSLHHYYFELLTFGTSPDQVRAAMAAGRPIRIAFVAAPLLRPQLWPTPWFSSPFSHNLYTSRLKFILGSFVTAYWPPF